MDERRSVRAHTSSYTHTDAERDIQKEVVVVEASFQSDCMRFNSISDFILGHFFSIYEEKKECQNHFTPVSPRFVHFRHACYCQCIRLSFLQLPFRQCYHSLYLPPSHTVRRRSKLNSFSIFAPFVLVSFKENGKFIEFILTRNMFASTRFLYIYIYTVCTSTFLYSHIHACSL